MSSATFIDDTGMKTYVPLENNPDVMTQLAHRLGASTALSFYDIYSMDEDVLNFIPRPAHALIFIAHADAFFKTRDEENNGMSEYDGCGADEPVLWIKQTIGHTCGLMALLHSMANGGARESIVPGSLADRLFRAAVPLKPKERAKLLYDSEELELIHQEYAQKGDSAAPSAADPNELHFISFVKADDNHLWELNGGMKGPVDRGELGQDLDVLSEKALDLGPKAFLRAAKEHGMSDIRFSIIAMAPTLE
ncbi:cysteine proteinase [Pseudovirgaria hyperparasitica]|uniref:Ubiquitin carboxyl-terminal hydrolase n=1 Tax=Pseudovirgaria hyperparasitica TaxID=470096 RepID=A0A6A6WIH7_9PEZI|nr:cysteine proteinase [Pseudovirgaria hyperparasitica]KAF2762069.1 cysteine proteinase [Pseudovirgaria hyperparasitica]